MNDDKISRLLELVLAGRPEPITATLLSQLGEEERNAYRATEEILARWAQAVTAPSSPSSALRARVLRDFAALRTRTARSALLVVDMIRDHLEEGRPLEVPRARAIVDALAAKIDRCRSEGVPIVYVVDEHPPDDPDLIAWGSHAVKGTGGSDVWPPLAPRAGDRVITKETYSAFTGTSLQDTLSELRCDTLIVTGCLTEMGLTATAMDALQRGYQVEIPPALQAGLSEATENVALGVMALMPPNGAARARLLASIAEETR